MVGNLEANHGSIQGIWRYPVKSMAGEEIPFARVTPRGLLAIFNLDRESSLLREVYSALARLRDGSYGVCLHCEEEINPKRLDAVPWTRWCIRCQELADRYQVENEPRNTTDSVLAE